MSSERIGIRVAVGVTIACVLLLTSTTTAAWWRLRAAVTPPAYAVGETIDVPADVIQPAPNTLLIFARSSCEVCQQQAPVLAEVVKTMTAKSPTTHIVVLSNDADGGAAYAAQLGQVPHRRIAVDAIRLKIVPTLVLVDQRGAILFAHEGRSASAVSLMEELIQRIPGR